jgi:signal transduction histidine kinase
MRLRTRSIRARITALLLLPLLSLAGLWIYTTATSARSVYGLIQVGEVYDWVGTPSDTLSRDLQSERLAAVRVAAAQSADPAAQLTAYRSAQSATDRDMATLRTHAADDSKLGGISDSSRSALNEVTGLGDRLSALRVGVTRRGTTWDAAEKRYSGLQDPFFQLRSELTADQTGELSRESGNLIELSRAREYISREQALVDGARESGRLPLAQYQDLLTSIAGQHLLFSVHTPELPAYEQGLFAEFTAGGDYARLGELEQAVSAAGQAGAGRAVPVVGWDGTADRVLGRLAGIDGRAADKATARGEQTALAVFERDAAVGALGLIAFAASLLLSIRAGRRLVRELVSLRNGAFDLANVRLPGVMHRLRDGERVNIAAEAPPIGGASGVHGDHDEIAQVGRAFNAVHRAAIGAAVDQSELRRGVSSVFVNLARRSQALLNRQLTLLDEMERRVADPADLEDLFKLDHLTTRMRRHADGLLILSGSAPGRGGRRPVPITDVVRAAVGEVEDYTRVAVPRLPSTAVQGGAVSDVVHLLAELVENATTYSPPHTRVRLRGERVANGFVLEIDDRGLGIGEQPLLEANDRLTAGGDFDLADSDRLGLFVVSRLAQRHGVRVSLAGNAYGGTTAVVLLPLTVLADPDTGAPLEQDPAEARTGVEGGANGTGARSRLGRQRAAELVQEPGRAQTPALTQAPGPAAGPGAVAAATTGTAPAGAAVGGPVGGRAGDAGSPDGAGSGEHRAARDSGPDDPGPDDSGSNDSGSNDSGSNDSGSNDLGSAASGLIEEPSSGPIAAAPPVRSDLSDLPRRRPRTRPTAVPPPAAAPMGMDAPPAEPIDRYPASALSGPTRPPVQPGAETAEGATAGAPGPGPEDEPSLREVTPASWRAGRPGSAGDHADDADAGPAESPTPVRGEPVDGVSAGIEPGDGAPADADPLLQRRSRRGVQPAGPESPTRASAVGRHRVGEDAPALPRRVRQASLAPQLREQPAADAGDEDRAFPAGSFRTPAAAYAERVRPADESSPGARQRSPEEVRATFGSFQHGLARGRRASDDRQPGREDE